jgi:shikimate dehydrogenase
MTPTNAMPRYGVLGNPVAHSRSPWIHERFARQTGQSLSYERFEVPIGQLEHELTRLRLPIDGAAGLSGCNVTVPFKFDAWQWALRSKGAVSTRAELAQAVNTLRFDALPDGSWQCHADNTDGVGLVRDLTVNAGCRLGGKNILLVGAGGAAAGVLGPLMALRPATIVLANRTVGRCQQLFERHRGMMARYGARLLMARLAVASLTPMIHDVGGFDLVVNATSASLAGEALTLPPGTLRVGGMGVDLMYGAAARPFLDWVQSRGGVARDGLGMLVEQAAESFEIWRGVRPMTAPVLAELRALVDAA